MLKTLPDRRTVKPVGPPVLYLSSVTSYFLKWYSAFVQRAFKPNNVPSERLRRARGSIVYFLGAGASKSICSQLPLAADLTLDSLSKPESYGNQIPPTGAECGALTQFLDSHPDWAALRGERLEYVLEKLRRESLEHYDLVLDFLYLRLSVENLAFQPYSSFAKWLRNVREKRDTIITTNYDTLIEGTLMSMGTGEFCLSMGALDRDALHWLDFGVHKSRIHEYKDGGQWLTPPELSVLLLKLHGSISWLFCEHCGTYLLDRVWQHAKEATKLPSGYGPCVECGQTGARRVVIVPPSPKKEYPDAAIREIWGRAKEVLGHAEEIIFAGFSLDKTDVGVRHLLQEAHGRASTRRVTIVDWNSSGVEKNYREVYGNLVDVAPERDWKQFLEKRVAQA